METFAPQIVPVTCGIIIDNGKVLAALRGRQMSQGWLWEFPGGKIQDSESAEECVIREINEELNITVKIHEALTPSIHHYPDKTIKLIPFICSIISGELTVSEHEKISWFTPSQLKSLQWAPADLPVLEEFLSLEHFSIEKIY